jgi:tRNA(Ile)-lysidine synthase
VRSAAARLPDLFAPGTRLVVGFSGGQDSTCLLHALANSHKRLELTAVHVDHALKAESAEAAQRAAQSAARIGVPCDVIRVDVAAYRENMHGWSVQQAARSARYQALASSVARQQAKALVVGHTADDQAETLLLNLVRGTGLSGLAAMRMDQTLELARLGPPVAELLAAPSTVRVARPLLTVTRGTTLAYCAQSGQLENLVEDASNQNRVYTRNRVRLDLLPALEQFNPAIRKVLARTADLAAEDVAALDAVAAELQVTLGPNGHYDLARWRAQPRAVQRRLLRLGLQSLVGILVDVPDAPIEDALDLLASAQPRQAYHMPYGIELCVDADAFTLRPGGRALPRRRRNTWELEVPRV